MKKALLVVLALVLVAALSVGLTMAYLTSQAEVTNTFTVGNVTITLDEADVDDSDNDDSTTDRDNVNEYKLIPGQTVTKDPTIHFGQNSEPSYLFVKVENNIANLLDNGIATQMAQNGWVAINENSNIYVYSQNGDSPTIVEFNTTDPTDNDYEVFGSIAVKSDVDATALNSVGANSKIKVTAYAVQAAGFDNKTADEIWAAARFN